MDKPKPWKIMVTCEHAANRIPEPYRHMFADANPKNLLATHRGYDIGAADLSRHLSTVLAAPLFMGKYSRLLADLNRHPRHRKVFSGVTKRLDAEEKQRLLKTYHAPYRRDITDHVRHEIETGGRVLHLSIHSFTPVLNGVIRNADIGFLYDPKRASEKAVSRHLLKTFRDNLNSLRYRCNYPYRGISDSLTTSLRKEFAGDCYTGIEIEINQKFPLGDPDAWKSFTTGFAETVRIALDGRLNRQTHSPVRND